MGNQFLDDLRQADCLIHVVDSSGLTDAEGKPAKDHDPEEDVKFLEREIDLWFAKIIERGMEKYLKKKQFGKVEVLQVLSEHLSGLGISKEQIKQALDQHGIDDLEEFSFHLRKISKPIIVAANKIDLPSSEENLKKMKEDFPELTIIPTCAAAEISLKIAKEKGVIKCQNNIIEIIGQVDDKQKKGLEFIQKNILEKYGSTGVQDCLNKAVFDVLGYIVVYPVADVGKLADKKGNVLPDAYLVRKGTTMKEFAFMIHSDIGEKFIGGLDAKKKIKLGADYELKNNDVVEILFQKR